ncbi:hypothetical protein AVEN_120928-1 [Araneus ventricosus]|uniref:Peptidase A2 domain-containing protein n=1 Tax=Araneus ventricosus TaxID=182803 RepID=A0A4Y2NM00_ARAVE|nr:hypothetical protein AVEN_120928-1 [Araneus ventricosus]
MCLLCLLNLLELKHRITEAVTDMNEGMLVKAWEETAYKLDLCRVINGAHIEHLKGQPPEVASLVRDILMNPDAIDPYTHLKTELINRSGESSQQEIRQILSCEQLCTRKPSELLRNMKRRAETWKVPETFMLELFLQRFPTSVQAILAAVTNIALDKAAEISDRILEVTPVPMEIHVVNKNYSNSMEEKLLREIEKLNARIDKLEFSRIVLLFAKTEVSKDREGIVKIEIRLFVGIIVASEKTANLKKAFRLAISRETKTAKNRRNMFFAADITLPVHSRPDIKSFLVDTGSDVPLIPANTYRKRNSSQQTLFAANTSTINVYGQKTLSLNFNLRRDFLWTFLIADESIPILGADLLHYFELVPDLRNKCLRDTKTKLQSVAI